MTNHAFSFPAKFRLSFLFDPCEDYRCEYEAPKKVDLRAEMSAEAPPIESHEDPHFDWF